MLSAVLSASAYRRSISCWPGSALVVAELHRDAHRLEHRDRLAAEVRALGLGGVVEEAAAVDRHRLDAVDRHVLEQVELDLGVGVEREPLVGGRRQDALEDEARVGVRRGAVGHHDVAEHPRRGRPLAAPRQDLERRRVGLGEHVGLVDPREPLDRGAVEPDPLRERALELGRRHRHGLQEPEHVGEPQPHEPDVTLLERAQHEVFLLAHAASVGPPRVGPGSSHVGMIPLPGDLDTPRSPEGVDRSSLGTSSRRGSTRRPLREEPTTWTRSLLTSAKISCGASGSSSGSRH